MAEDLTSLLRPNSRVHIIGGGGVGMSGLALLLHNLGFRVSASDQNNSEYLQRLAREKITTWQGSEPARLAGVDCVFYSTAIPPGDAELSWAREQGLPVFSRHPLLAFLTSRYFTIAISGTHGKTTTSALTAFVLEQAGLDPNALIGGKLLNWQSNFRLGQGRVAGKPLLVIEADESDKSFLSIEADIAVLTNTDFDHVDHYENSDEARSLFTSFFRNCLARGGKVVASVECLDLLTEVEAGVEVQKLKQAFDFSKKGYVKFDGSEFKLSLPGRHNQYNASAVLQVLQNLQVDVEVSARALAAFKGVGRRMQLLGSATLGDAEIEVIDDYAHHPQEMKAVVKTLKPGGNLIIAWEPHRVSRFMHFFDDFNNTIEQDLGYKNLVLLPMFYSGDNVSDFTDFSARRAELEQKSGLVLAEYKDLPAILKLVEPGQKNLVVFMGAGNSTAWAGEFLKVLQQQAGQ